MPALKIISSPFSFKYGLRYFDVTIDQLLPKELLTPLTIDLNNKKSQLEMGLKKLIDLKHFSSWFAFKLCFEKSFFLNKSYIDL